MGKLWVSSSRKEILETGVSSAVELELLYTGWVSILPPVIAIVLALVTKEVYSSLFAGILSGMLIYSFASGDSILAAVTRVFDMMAKKIGENGYMIIFLALLWAVVVEVTRSGGSQAYGKWAGAKLKSRRSSQLATALLGLLIFIDDGFNCLTVGTVMGPITDKHKISREKLAYLIDATAAPVCIIAPVSSWAVAVASELDSAGGFDAFLKVIPYNLYALLTLLMVFVLCVTGMDFGPMRQAEARAAAGESGQLKSSSQGGAPSPKGRVIDLVLPILVLVVCAILGMAYVGGFFSGTPFSEAIGANPTAGLTLGAFAGLITAMALYLPRRLMTFTAFMEGAVQGIQNIVPPMLILILSWSLSGVCREMIGTGAFVSQFIDQVSLSLNLLPVIVFAVAAFLSFSTGTAWGTFGILIPIVTMIFDGSTSPLLIPTLGATLAGSVCGDHCSPLSDTTILSSTGAQVRHIDHVETQLPYATLVAVICALGYLLMGFVPGPWIPLALSAAVLLVVLCVLFRRGGGEGRG